LNVEGKKNETVSIHIGIGNRFNSSSFGTCSCSENSMRVVYIAGAYRANTEWGIVQNIRKAEEKALELWGKGFVVLCPHKNTERFQGSLPDRVFLDGCLELLKRCDALYLLSNWKTSEGSKEEFKLAVKLGKEIILEDEDEYQMP